MRTWQLFTALILVICILIFSVIWKNFLNTPLVPANQPIDYVFKSGETSKTLAKDLHSQGLLAHPEFLVLLAYWKGVTKDLQAGEYLITPGMTPSQLLTDIAAGHTHYHHFTIVEGWNFQQLLVALNANPALTHTLTNLPLPDILNKIGLPPGNPEGLFRPATYRFTAGTTDAALLQEAYQAMQTELNTAWQQRAANLPYKNPYEALIAASIVERETKLADQQALVAGVIVQRLEKNMPLQMDSTLVYETKLHSGTLNATTYTTDTPYNTYTHPGLPITPIAMPGTAALQAALHPLLGSAFYFVETGLGDGSLRFSANFATHTEAVTAYQLNEHILQTNLSLQKKLCQNRWYWSAILRGILQC